MTEPSRSRGLLLGLAIAAFGAVLAYLFFGEHRVHLLGYLPFLFLLACPLLHMTMHGGHGGHSTDSPGKGAAPHQDHRQGGLDA
jgi:hypothetical protein